MADINFLLHALVENAHRAGIQFYVRGEHGEQTLENAAAIRNGSQACKEIKQAIGTVVDRLTAWAEHEDSMAIMVENANQMDFEACYNRAQNYRELVRILTE